MTRIVKSSRNRGKTYTRRTRAVRAVYAVCRKSLSYIVGLRGVEPLTSRLSGGYTEGGCVAGRGEFHRGLTSRFGRRERRHGVKFTAFAYTPRTHEHIALPSRPALAARGRA